VKKKSAAHRPLSNFGSKNFYSQFQNLWAQRERERDVSFVAVNVELEEAARYRNLTNLLDSLTGRWVKK